MCLIIKGGNYVENKIIIVANESTYFKFIIREIDNCLKRKWCIYFIKMNQYFFTA